MKKYLSIVVLFTAFLLQACESADIIDVNIEGNERIVVEGILFSGKTFSGVKITRTLPLYSSYDIKQAEIKDAYAYLVINGAQIVPLHYTSDGIYTSLHEMKITAGYSYEFYAYINDNKVYSKTTAPYTPRVISAKYDNTGFFQARVQPRPGEAYGAIWVILSAVTKKGNNFYSIDGADGTSLEPVITRTTMFDDVYLDPVYSNKRGIQVYAFDKQFAPYFNNNAKNILAENNVLTGSSGVAWNVNGKNTIGMFIGVAEGGIESEF
jgi:hypothetical protein